MTFPRFPSLSVLALVSAALAAPLASASSYKFQVFSKGLAAPEAALIAPTLSNFNVPDTVVGAAPFTLSPPTSNSTGGITYSSSNPAVASVSGQTVTVVSAGTTTITATQLPSPGFSAGAISAVFQVAPPLPAGYVKSDGITWTPADTTQRTYPQSLQYCSSTSFNGLSGWRLPTADEIALFYSKRASSGYSWNRPWYWTATPRTGDPHSIAILDLGDGYIKYNPDTGATNYVTCVR